MASMNNVAIQFEFEPIVKITCFAIDCQHNIEMCCNLKRIGLDKTRQFGEYNPLTSMATARTSHENSES